VSARRAGVIPQFYLTGVRPARVAPPGGRFAARNRNISIVCRL